MAATAIVTGTGSAEGAGPSTLVYLGSAGSSASSGRLQSSAPSSLRHNTTVTGRQTGWYELRATGEPVATVPSTSAPAPSGLGYLWSERRVEGVPAGTWSATITLKSSGRITLTPTVRFFARGDRGFRPLASTTGSALTLGSTRRTVTLPGVSVPAVAFRPGERLYADVVANVTDSCCSSAAVLNYDNGGDQLLSLPTASSPSPTATPTVSPTVSASASPTPTTASSATTSASASPTATTSTATSTSTAPSRGTVWRPRPGTSWQWQITGTVDPGLPVQMYDIDLFDAQPAASSYTVPGFGSVSVPKGDNAGIIATLHDQGKVVICYLDTGAWESYRPDQALFPSAVIGNSSGWSGERWLDIRPGSWPAFKPLIEARLDLAARSGCDGVEPDQNNPLGNRPGFAITAADQKAWYLEVARLAHARGLSVGQKNGIETTDADTVAAFDWNLNEECNMYSECDALAGFVAAGKAVFQVEYSDEGMTASAFCAKDNAANYDGLLKTLDLDATRQSCR